MNIQIIIILSLIIVVTVNAYGEYPEFSMHIPPIMIQDIKYEGMILLKEPATTPYTILLAADDHVRIPYDTTIPPGYNHAIFPIYPVKTGGSITSAILPDGRTVSTQYQIFENNDRTALQMVPPASSIRIPDIPIILFHTDKLGNPTPAPNNITVTVSASPSIQAQSQIIIYKGQNHTILHTAIHGTGYITVSAPNATGHTLSITKQPDTMNVRVGLAPNPAPAGAAISYFVWIEQNGIPYRLATPQEVYITTDDPQVAGPRPGHNNDITYTTKLYDDILHGLIYTAETAGPDEMRPRQDMARITASIPGIGSDTAILHVGVQPPDAKHAIANRLKSCTLQNNTIFVGECGRLLDAFAVLGGHAGEISGDSNVQRALRSSSIQPHPDITEMWAFPDVHYNHIWLVAGFYHTIDDIIIPVTPPDMVQLTLSDYIDTPPQQLTPYKGIGPIQTHINTPGPTRVTLHGTGFVEGHFDILGSPPNFGHLHITPAIHDSGILGIISVLDDDGHIIQMGANIQNFTIQAEGDIKIRDIVWYGDIGIIYGTGKGVIHVWMMPYTPYSTEITHHYTPDGIHLWMPHTVHVSEEFPVTVHATDSHDIPIFRIYDAAFSSLFTSASPQSRMVADHKDTGTITAMWHGIADWHDTEAFQNDMTNIQVESNQYTIPLGQNITITVMAPDTHSDIQIESDVQYHRYNNTYTAKPATPGTYISNVTIHRPGWDTYTYQLQHMVDHHATVQYVATSGAGTTPPHIISLNLADTQHDIHQGTGTMVIPGTYTAHLPRYIQTEYDITYRLHDVIIHDTSYGSEPSVILDIQNDTLIQSIYDKVISIHADADTSVDITGDGEYIHGDTVMLHAESIPQWWGLIWHTPEVWYDLPLHAIAHDANTVSFTALEPAYITVQYRYSFDVLIIILAVASCIPLILLRERLSCIIQDIR